MALKTTGQTEGREEFDTLRQRAKVLNFGIPGGLGPRSLVAYAKSPYGVILTLEEAGEFRRRLIEEVYPELGLYLADDGMEVLAPQPRGRGRGLLAGVRPGRRPLGAVVGGIRNVVRGRARKADGRPYNPRYCKGVWDDLIAMNRNAALAPSWPGGSAARTCTVGSSTRA